MPISQAKRKANDKWDKQNMTTFSVKVTNRFAEIINKAVEDKQTTRNAYVKNAIKEALIRDGFMDSE